MSSGWRPIAPPNRRSFFAAPLSMMASTDPPLTWREKNWRQRILIEDETANLLTHGAGLLLAIVGTAWLLKYAQLYGNTWQVIGCVVYGASLVLLYAASTLSHSFRHQGLRHFFRMLDQVCI